MDLGYDLRLEVERVADALEHLDRMPFPLDSYRLDNSSILACPVRIVRTMQYEFLRRGLDRTVRSRRAGLYRHMED